VSVILPVVAAALAFLAGRVVIRRREVARLERRVEAHMRLAPRHDESSSDGGSLRRQLDGLERSLASHGWWDVMVTRLERAGVERRPVDVFVLMCTATLVLTVLATTASLLLGLLLLVGVPAGWWLFLGARAERRIRAFEKQLPDLLGALASSLRAGHGFLQSLQAAAHDAPAPTGPELRRALTETRLGRPVDEALAGVVARMPSKDFSYVLTAIAVQRQASRLQPQPRSS
jgi:tight adherence protein B